jgi:hypothetical protein
VNPIVADVEFVEADGTSVNDPGVVGAVVSTVHELVVPVLLTLRAASV